MPKSSLLLCRGGDKRQDIQTSPLSDERVKKGAPTCLDIDNQVFISAPFKVRSRRREKNRVRVLRIDRMVENTKTWSLKVSGR